MVGEIMAAHIHAENMRLYAEDAAETETPWERWQFRDSDMNKWCELENHPSWNAAQYSRKTRTININGFEVPEPVRNQLEYGTDYFIPDLFVGYVEAYTWRGDTDDSRVLGLGLIHLTAEAAVLHAKALLSLTKMQERGE